MLVIRTVSVTVVEEGKGIYRIEGISELYGTTLIKKCIFFDEVQWIPAGEEAVNAFQIDFNCDIYLIIRSLFL